MIERKRNGITRRVYLVGRFAIKRPTLSTWRHMLQGLLANINERAWWSLTRDERLCPVRFAMPGGWLIVMDRAKHLELPDAGSYTDDFGILTAERVAERLTEFIGLPMELKRDSFGILDGRLVAIDYGDGMNHDLIPKL